MRVAARIGTYDGIAVVHLSGELDMANLGELRAVVTETASAHRCLILDLRRVTYMDSSPLGYMIDLHRRLSERGGALAVAAARNGVGRIFRITGLAETMNLSETLDQAAARLSDCCAGETISGDGAG